MPGFRRALAAALALHEDYPGNRDVLAGKQPRPVEYARPEAYPSLAGDYQPNLDYEGDVVQSCMHCHQIRDAERLAYRQRGESIPDQVLFPYPLPESVGLSLDVRHPARVDQVEEGSVSEAAGFEEGDEIVSLAGQPLVSIADVQWVLHTAGASAAIPAEVRRGDRNVLLTLTLQEGWRHASDISWRVSTWDLRRMGLGGLLLADLTDDERRERGLGLDGLALFARHVGEYGEHAVALHAGFRKGDVIVAFDGLRNRMSESEVLAYTLQEKEPGDEVDATVLREGRRVKLTLPLSD
jgi:predicted metalloprotease with PDZ domain